MIYGSIRAHVGPYGWPEVKNNVGKVKIIISDGDFFWGYVRGIVFLRIYKIVYLFKMVSVKWS